MNVDPISLTQLVITLIVFGAGIIAAAIYIKSALVRQRHEELQGLADTRGKRIEDLEHEIRQLTQKLSQLEGRVAALQGLKATEIADEVVSRLSERLTD